jgi:MFS family permease
MAHGFAALRIRNYRLFWTGQVVSRTGTWMQTVSLPWLVLALGGSPIELGIVTALEFTPSLVLAPFGGVYADRLDRRRALVVTQALASIQVIALLVVTVSGLVTIPLIMALALALGFVNAIDAPLRQSLVADLVPRDVLANAIALNAMAFNGARIVGPAIAGVTIAIGTGLFGSVTAGVSFNLALNAVSFVAVLVALRLMNPAEITRRERPERDPPVLESLREGIGYAARTPIVRWSLLLVAVVATFGINFRILLPLFTQEVLHLGADAYGALYAALGLGALAGAFSLALLHQRRFVALMVGGAIAFGIALAGLAFTSSALIAGGLLVGAGFSQMLLTNTANAAVQSHVSDELRGRVVALYITIVQGSTPVGGILAGILVEHGSVALAFGVGAVASITAAVVVGLRVRAVRHAERVVAA